MVEEVVEHVRPAENAKRRGRSRHGDKTVAAAIAAPNHMTFRRRYALTLPMSLASFPTTRRSVVLALASTDAAERTRAFDTLVACYWKPLYKFARVAWGRSREDAEDLTQSFFARAFEKESLAAYDVAKASFRTFLRLLFERHVNNEWKAGQRIKRGWRGASRFRIGGGRGRR